MPEPKNVYPKKTDFLCGRLFVEITRHTQKSIAQSLPEPVVQIPVFFSKKKSCSRQEINLKSKKHLRHSDLLDNGFVMNP